MERTVRAQRTSIWVMWFLTVFGAVEVDAHRDAFAFWCGIWMLGSMLPLAVFTTYRRLADVWRKE